MTSTYNPISDFGRTILFTTLLSLFVNVLSSLYPNLHSALKIRCLEILDYSEFGLSYGQI